MSVKYKASPLSPAEFSEKIFEVEQVAKCPLCKRSISPVHLNSVFSFKDPNFLLESHILCSGCNHSFIASYQCQRTSTSIKTGQLLSVEPQRYYKQDFDNSIVELSPQFDKIYNQALAAESSGLDEIAGLGYRKALEFLIKDFAIHEHADKEDKIKSMPLAACIKDFIDSPNIKTLATRSAWIGNDEAHYIRKQEDRDVEDMKSFIKATVYFISMILITEDAASMEPK